MKRSVVILLVASVMFSLTGCGIFKKYTDTTVLPENLYGEGEMVGQSVAETSIAEMSWREFFEDSNLQVLIDSALARNTTLAAARYAVDQAEALLKSAKLGYLPVISLNPSININPDNGYSLSAAGSWGVNGFGSITNRKREAQALAVEAADEEEAMRSQIVALVASSYCQLMLLDRELEIMISTEEIWGKVLDTQQALMDNGKAYSTSVNQMKASLYGVTLQRMDVENMISDMEYAICMILRETPHHIERTKGDRFHLPVKFGTGVPSLMLENRADVRAAGRRVEAAYYVTNQARCAMLPSLTLTGMIGWGNNGAPISSPADLLSNAIASLTQPIFAQGQLRANLKVSQAQQKIAADAYVQTVLEAGNEVNAALRNCQLAEQKEIVYKSQIAALEDAYSGTQTLMSNGKATYIEVLTAQEALLQAQLDNASNLFFGAQSLIDLYVSLGGGVR